jgi:ubiquinol-cytochrome c reductase cytochrome b subunit
MVGVGVFLMAFVAVMFFFPEFGGWFLERDNFAPANILQTPSNIIPLWYFTPYYSILRATTEQLLLYGLTPLVIVIGALAFVSLRGLVAKGAALGISALLLLGFWAFDAKVWGVVLMGLSLVLFFFLPWLDRSPVNSIRYRGWMYKTALTLFTVNFLVLGYLGTQPASGLNVIVAGAGTIIYLLFFLLMPWYTSLDKTKPVPERLTWK